jgi:signal transduction histidine kinase
MRAAYRILVADDDPTTRRILVGSLAKAGYETLEATTGFEALEIAREQVPELILLDIGMPGLDGFDVCKTLKSQTETAQIPVIFITVKSKPKDVEKAFSVGASDYVTKPPHMSEVKARVSVHLGLRRIQKELKESHAQLLRAQKLESIGQLAAGVAHEINTPTQYVGDNTRFLEESFRELAPILKKADELAESVRQGTSSSELADELKAALEEADVEYLGEEIPRAIEQSLNGIDRVRKIVQSMKDFSHPGVEGMVSIDLNRAIESTITVASNEWKYVAELETDFDPELPAVSCLQGEINQVVLNLIVNAAHAIADVVVDGEEGRGTITISTRRDGEFAEVRIGDTGSGIPEAAQGKIFDPFFTTKEVGKGTGQGLSIAHAVVVNKHGGTLDFDTEIGKGTTFVLRLPLDSPGVE